MGISLFMKENLAKVNNRLNDTQESLNQRSAELKVNYDKGIISLETYSAFSEVLAQKQVELGNSTALAAAKETALQEGLLKQDIPKKVFAQRKNYLKPLDTQETC